MRFRADAELRRTDATAGGSNHIRYRGDDGHPSHNGRSTVLYRTGDAVRLTRPVHLVFGTDEPFDGDARRHCREFLDRTRDYWGEWVRRLSIPTTGRKPIIRRRSRSSSATSRRQAPSSPPHDLDSRSARFRPQLGLSFLLAARCLFRREGAQPHRRDATMEEFISYILTSRRETTRCAGLRHRATDPMESDRAASRGLSRRRPVRIGNAAATGPARHLWQRHPGGDADVLRPAPAEARR